MGWWSTDIMGGDSPLDVEDAFFEIAQVVKFPESGGFATLSKEVVEKNMKAFIAEVKRHADYEPEIAWQVLAVTVLHSGAKLNKAVKTKMIDACDNDEWSFESRERRDSVSSLKKALLKYDGTPIQINSKGLFEVMEERIGNKD